MTAPEKILAIIAKCCDESRALPHVSSLRDISGLSHNATTKALRELVESGQLSIRIKSGAGVKYRRAILPDGRSTPWAKAEGLHRNIERPVIGSSSLRPPPLSAESRALIDAAVAAGKVRRVRASAPAELDFNRRVWTAIGYAHVRSS